MFCFTNYGLNDFTVTLTGFSHNSINVFELYKLKTIDQRISNCVTI